MADVNLAQLLEAGVHFDIKLIDGIQKCFLIFIQNEIIFIF